MNGQQVLEIIVDMLDDVPETDILADFCKSLAQWLSGFLISINAESFSEQPSTSDAS